MRTPKEIAESLEKEEQLLLGRILDIERQYQNISKLSPQRIKEISDKIIKEIETVS